MSRLLIDLYKTRNLNSGIGSFSINFAETLSKKNLPGDTIDYLCPGNCPPGDWGLVNLEKVNLQKRYFPRLNRTYDIWHSLYQFPSYLPNRNTPWILTIHDLNFMVEKDRRKAAHYLKKLQQNIDRSSAVSVISDYTRSQVVDYLDVKEKPLFRIYNGISVKSFPGAPKPGFLTNRNFFFTIGIISAKKNFGVLVPMMKKFPEYDLVIAGDNDSAYAKRILELVDASKMNGRVHLPGKISDSDRYWLYSHCRAFLFPSLAEGVGMPVIEAMLLGKPVFTSTCASLPEIGGNHAFYRQNFDPDHMAEVVKNGLDLCERQEETFSASMVAHAQKFSWSRCVDDYLMMYREVIVNRRSVTP